MGNMTVFYSKSTGDIKVTASGDQDFNFFGSDQADYRLIYGRIVIEDDEYVRMNPNLFTIADEQLKLKPQSTYKYQVVE